MANMIPPALSEMRQDMLPWQFNDFVHELPHVKQNWISNDKTTQEPVAKVRNIVVVEVIPQILESEFAVIIVSVMAFQNGCI